MLNNSESFDLWFLKKENQISKDGMYIKKVITTKDFFDVMELRKERYLYQDDEKIFLVKKKDEVLATISYIQNERNFTITTFESKDENIDAKILHYIENEIVIHTTPATRKINKSINKTLFIKEGYEEKDNIYVKEIIKKHNAL